MKAEDVEKLSLTWSVLEADCNKVVECVVDGDVARCRVSGPIERTFDLNKKNWALLLVGVSGLNLHEVPDFELAEPVLDGESISIGVHLKSGQVVARSFWCPNASKDSRVTDAAHWVRAVLTDGGMFYPPPPAEGVRQRVVRTFRNAKGSLEREMSARRAKKKADEMAQRLQEVGLDCPHCEYSGQEFQYKPTGSFFVCQKCGRSLSP